MRKFRKILLFAIATVICIFGMQMATNAATFSVTEGAGELYEDQSVYYSFNVPVDSKVEVFFIGYNADLSKSEQVDTNVVGTWGEFSWKIIDDLDEEVYYQGSEDLLYDDAKRYVELDAGTYRLQITSNYYSIFEYVFKVKMTPLGTVKTTSFKLNKSSITMTRGNEYQLKTSLTPKYATEKITWKSSNKKVATVNSQGKITAKNLGTATITVKCGKFTKKCKVTVNKVAFEYWTGKKVSLKKYTKYISGYKKAKWSSSNKSAVSVSKKGTIETKKQKRVVITCKIKGKKYSFVIYSYSKKTAKKKTINKLKSLLKNPKSLIVNKVSYPAAGVVEVDYSAMNGFGGYDRDIFIGFYYKGKFYYY